MQLAPRKGIHLALHLESEAPFSPLPFSFPPGRTLVHPKISSHSPHFPPPSRVFPRGIRYPLHTSRATQPPSPPIRWRIFSPPCVASVPEQRGSAAPVHILSRPQAVPNTGFQIPNTRSSTGQISHLRQGTVSC